MSKIQMSHISKSYVKGDDVVKNFNLEIEDGEFLVIVGSSGSGKSTLLRMVAGLEEITSGELMIDGVVVNDFEPKKRNVAMVFQNYALFPNLTVEENMEFALKMQRMPKAKRREKVQEMARILGIEDILKRKAKKLSGGQCQRIAIGRALVCNPSIFLLDEPLSNLDHIIATELRGEIARLQKELGITMLYVTHNQTEAMTLGDRIVVMDQGEIKQVDTAQNIYCKPQNLFVARFIGSSPMNFFSTDCVETAGQVVLQNEEGTIPLPEWKGKILREKEQPGRRILAGIRSEDIYPECEGCVVPELATAALDVIVSSIEVMGAEKKIHFKYGDSELSAVVRTYVDVNPGDSVTVHMDTNQLQLFDPDSEVSLIY